jgi:hypothetical protein
MSLDQIRVEILDGCRATTGMSPLDFAAALGLAGRTIPAGASGGTSLDVTPKGAPSPVRVYAIAREGKFLLGLRADFELLGLAWGRACDKLDTLRERQRPTG